MNFKASTGQTHTCIIRRNPSRSIAIDGSIFSHFKSFITHSFEILLPQSFTTWRAKKNFFFRNMSDTHKTVNCFIHSWPDWTLAAILSRWQHYKYCYWLLLLLLLLLFKPLSWQFIISAVCMIRSCMVNAMSSYRVKLQTGYWSVEGEIRRHVLGFSVSRSQISIQTWRRDYRGLKQKLHRPQTAQLHVFSGLDCSLFTGNIAVFIKLT